MKLLLAIDVADDVAEAYEDFTVDYDLRGTPKEDRTVNESIKYVEDCPLKPMPSQKSNYERVMAGSFQMDLGYTLGWNDCLEEIEK